MAVYSALWLHLAKSRLHEDDADDITQVSSKAKLSDWPGPALKLFMGQLTADELMAAASNPDPETQQGQLCEANFYAGENELLHQHRAAAQSAIPGSPRWLPQGLRGVWGSLTELKRLAAPPAVHKPAAGK